MRNQHERYEKLAVGHVLGGLDADESADFRNHLLGCRNCRMRVAELRDLAADLDAAERDERARAQVRTEVVRRDDADGEPAAGTPRIGVRHVAIAAAVVAVLAGAMAFWNLHLRTVAASYSQSADYRADTLQILADGVPATVTTSDQVAALVAADDEHVAFTVSGLPELASGERLEIWLLDADADATRALDPVPAQHLTDGVVAGYAERGDAVTVLVTHERLPFDDTPGERHLVRAELAGAG